MNVEYALLELAKWMRDHGNPVDPRTEFYFWATEDDAVLVAAGALNGRPVMVWNGHTWEVTARVKP